MRKCEKKEERKKEIKMMFISRKNRGKKVVCTKKERKKERN